MDTQFLPVAGACGAEVRGIDLNRTLSDEVSSKLRDRLAKHQVLFFRNHDLSPERHIALGEVFGQLEVHPVLPHLPQYPQIVVLDSQADHPAVEEWHTDVTYDKCPPLGAVLYCRIAPEFGGDTLWSSMTAAYEGLSDSWQRHLSSLTAIHDFAQGYRHTLRQPGARERLQDVLARKVPVSHPVIRTHPVTGKKGLFVNQLFTSHIEGMSELESRHTLAFLYEHVTTPEFTCRLRWEKDTIAIWDNRSTQHRPVNDFLPQHRRMHRVVISGDEVR